MSIKQPIYHEFDLNATSGNSRVISWTHTDDAHVDVIELCVKQQGAPVDITGATVIARMVLHGTTDVLLNDSVTCTVNDAGNILIPFDNAAIESRKGIVKIEVNITRAPDILTLQFPLWVKINGSILDDATVDPHSEGTIPELLKDAADALEEATHALEDAKDYDKLENKPQINSYTLSGNKSSDDLGLQKKLTAGTNITIANDGTISAKGGITSYNDLTDKPTINNTDIAGTYISDKLYVQDVGNAKRIYLQNIKLEDLYQSDKNRIMTLILANTQYDLNNILQAAQIIDINEPVIAYSNLPINSNGLLFCINHYTQIYLTYRENLTDKTRIFVRQKTDYTSSWSLWQELTGGGSKIVSGVVNQDGTITFTDSDGNTFTTTGSSVIGADGFSPTATVTQTASGATVSITDKNGTTTANISNGADGQDYVLTAQDKSDIADIVLSELPTTQGVLYGNTSN